MLRNYIMDKKWFQQVLTEKVNVLLTGRKEEDDDDGFFEDSRIRGIFFILI